MGDKRKRSAAPVAGNDTKKLKNNQSKSTQSKSRTKSKVKPHLLPKDSKKRKTKDEQDTIASLPAKLIVPNSNWSLMKSKIQQKDQKYTQSVEKKHDLDVHAHQQKVKALKLAKKKEARTAEWIDNASIVAMDCEMVGVGLSGKQSVLARCSLVDYEGNVIYDKNVRPVEKVTDFRTHVSGIRSRTLRNAIPFAQCLKEVGPLLKDKIVVGHALKNDFQALMFTPPKNLIRDTSKYRPYMRRKMTGTVCTVTDGRCCRSLNGCLAQKLYPKSLKHLAEEFLGIQIQSGEHNSVEDARASLALYKRVQFTWEKYLRSNKSIPGGLIGVAPAIPKKPKTATEEINDATLKAVREMDSDDDFDDKQKTLVVPNTKELVINEFAE